MLLSSFKTWLTSWFRKAVEPGATKDKRRKGATAMEYLVVSSFILVVLIVAVQSIGGVTKGLFGNSASATSKTNASSK